MYKRQALNFDRGDAVRLLVDADGAVGDSSAAAWAWRLVLGAGFLDARDVARAARTSEARAPV